MKLHRQLILLVLAALMPLVVLSAVLGAAALRQSQSQMQQEAASRVQMLAGLVTRELHAEIESLQTFAQSPIFDDKLDAQRFRAYSERLLQLHPLWMDVSLTDISGDRLFDTPQLPPKIARRVIDLESHAQAVRTGKPVVGRVLRSPRGIFAFAIFVPVVRDGKVISVVVAVVRPTAVRDLLLATSLPAGWRLGVLDRADHVIARTLAPDAATQLAAKEARDAVARSPAGVYRALGADGLPLVVAYRVAPESGWSVHMAMPLNLYEAPARRALWLVGGGGAVSLALMVLFLGLLTREMRIRQREAAALEEGHRLEALGRITGGVAHDFNNILMIVQGSAELLKRRILGNPKAEALTEAILAGAQRGQTLTRQLLAVGRRSSHQPISFHLQDMAADLTALLQRTVPADVVTSMDLDHDVWPIHADPRALEVALINLAVNARDAMPSGGKLTISASNVALQKGRDEGTGLIGEFVALSVADTGVGIAEAHLAHVFEPFYTTKPTGKGTGLGLSQVYGFARQSQGAVTVRSKLGEGATVTLYLPRSSAPPVKLAASSAGELFDNDGHVLLVEDNHEVAQAVEAMLTALGYSVVRVADAAAALARLEGGETFDAVLSDIVMDGMSGLDFGRRVLVAWPLLPLVLMTGYSEALVGPSNEDFPILAKPFGPSDLTTAINRARARIRETVPG